MIQDYKQTLIQVHIQTSLYMSSSRSRFSVTRSNFSSNHEFSVPIEFRSPRNHVL